MNEIPSGMLRLQNINYEHFIQALNKSKPSVNVNDLDKYADWTKKFGQ
jgi:SpoVK/Ycf46/Vps4 family AAA+-type ATPase